MDQNSKTLHLNTSMKKKESLKKNSAVRNPEQNGVAKRKNGTLI